MGARYQGRSMRGLLLLATGLISQGFVPGPLWTLVRSPQFLSTKESSAGLWSVPSGVQQRGLWLPAQSRKHSSNSDIIDVQSSSDDGADEEDGKRQWDDTSPPQSIIDLAKLTQPDMNVRVPFVDTLEKNHIDCIVHFLVEIDGIKYTIATPYDHTVALCYNKNGINHFLLPGEDLTNEVAGVVGEWLNDKYGTDLVLRNTPKTLTIMGDVQKLSGERDEKLKNSVRSMLLSNDRIDYEDEEDEFLDGLLKKHFGVDYSKAVDAALEQAFEDVKAEEVSNVAEESGSNKKALAEKLVVFEHNGREYSLVRMLEPMVIVGKEDISGMARQLLLTPEEAESVMPHLEKVCEEEGRKLISKIKR